MMPRFILLLFLLTAGAAAAQPTKVWDNACFGEGLRGPAAECRLVELSDSSIFVSGERSLGRLDAAGRCLWSKRGLKFFTGMTLKKLCGLPGGDALISGAGDTILHRGRMSPIYEANWVSRINPDGDTVWKRNLSFECEFILPLPNREAVLGGTNGYQRDTAKRARRRADYHIAKIDADGKLLWETAYGGGDADYLNSMVATPDGGFVLMGRSRSGVSGDRTAPKESAQGDVWIIKVDAKGRRVWDTAFGYEDGMTFPSALLALPDGGVMLTYVRYLQTDKEYLRYQLYMAKLSPDGQVAWQGWLGPIKDREKCMLLWSDRCRAAFVGFTSCRRDTSERDSPYCYSDYRVMKVDTNGYVLWDKTYKRGEFKSMLLLPDGGLLLGGDSQSGKGGDKSEGNFSEGRECDSHAYHHCGWWPIDYWVVKIDGEGHKLWDKTLGGDGTEQLHTMILLRDGSVLLGGDSAYSTGGSKTTERGGYWLVKLR